MNPDVLKLISKAASSIEVILHDLAESIIALVAPPHEVPKADKVKVHRDKIVKKRYEWTLIVVSELWNDCDRVNAGHDVPWFKQHEGRDGPEWWVDAAHFARFHKHDKLLTCNMARVLERYRAPIIKEVRLNATPSVKGVWERDANGKALRERNDKIKCYGQAKQTGKKRGEIIKVAWVLHPSMFDKPHIYQNALEKLMDEIERWSFAKMWKAYRDAVKTPAWRPGTHAALDKVITWAAPRLNPRGKKKKR